MGKRDHGHLNRVDAQTVKRWTQDYRGTRRGYRSVAFMFLVVSGCLFWYAWGFFVEMNLAAENYRYRSAVMLNAYRISGRGLTQGEWAIISAMFKATLSAVLGLMTLMMAMSRYRMARLGGAFYRDWIARTTPVEAILFDEKSAEGVLVQSDEAEAIGVEVEESIGVDEALPDDPELRREMLLAELRAGYPTGGDGAGAGGDVDAGGDDSGAGLGSRG